MSNNMDSYNGTKRTWEDANEDSDENLQIQQTQRPRLSPSAPQSDQTDTQQDCKYINAVPSCN
jgi:hypothetical protein